VPKPAGSERRFGKAAGQIHWLAVLSFFFPEGGPSHLLKLSKTHGSGGMATIASAAATAPGLLSRRFPSIILAGRTIAGSRSSLTIVAKPWQGSRSRPEAGHQHTIHFHHSVHTLTNLKNSVQGLTAVNSNTVECASFMVDKRRTNEMTLWSASVGMAQSPLAYSCTRNSSSTLMLYEANFRAGTFFWNM
jgi:hypothetical protein